MRPRVAVAIPALNEEAAVGFVVADLLRALADLHPDVVVADNGSTDRTGEVAAAAGARVVREEERGYGAACLAAIAALGEWDVLLFLDADRSDLPEEAPAVLAPLLAGDADVVIGSRVLGRREPGALLPQQRLGNLLATTLLRLLFGQRYTDLGPFRAVTRAAWEKLDMRDRTYGWTVELQAKAPRAGLRIVEVPVSYRKRIGRSKVSGTLSGSAKAGAVILATIFRLARWRPAGTRR